HRDGRQVSERPPVACDRIAERPPTVRGREGEQANDGSIVVHRNEELRGNLAPRTTVVTIATWSRFGGEQTRLIASYAMVEPGWNDESLAGPRFSCSSRREDDEPPTMSGCKVGAPDAAQLNGGVDSETSDVRHRECSAQRASKGAQRDLLLGPAREHAV